jgi:hypothetical protein
VSSWHAHRDPTITHERLAGSRPATDQASSYTVDDPEGHRQYFGEALRTYA